MNPRRVDTFRRLYDLLSLPILLTVLYNNTNISPDHQLTRRRWWRLGWRIYRNSRRIETASGYRSHLLMAVKLLELPRSLPGVIVECGCYMGGSTVNLSLIAELVDRDLIVYDSFEGLPSPPEEDVRAQKMAAGMYLGTLETVQENVRAHGAIERCEFRAGWFADSLPAHTEPIALLFLDVDFDSSIHDCLIHLWPRLNQHGFLFTDDYARPTKSAVFFSERYWRTYFDREPPGLLGSGTGVGLGNFFTGLTKHNVTPLESATSVAYTRPRFEASWVYFPGSDPDD